MIHLRSVEEVRSQAQRQWLRNMLYIAGGRQWYHFYPVTPPAYAHRLEACLNPPPPGTIPYPLDRRVRP